MAEKISEKGYFRISLKILRVFGMVVGAWMIGLLIPWRFIADAPVQESKIIGVIGNYIFVETLDGSLYRGHETQQDYLWLNINLNEWGYEESNCQIPFIPPPSPRKVVQEIIRSSCGARGLGYILSQNRYVVLEDGSVWKWKHSIPFLLMPMIVFTLFPLGFILIKAFGFFEKMIFENLYTKMDEWITGK